VAALNKQLDIHRWFFDHTLVDLSKPDEMKQALLDIRAKAMSCAGHIKEAHIHGWSHTHHQNEAVITALKMQGVTNASEVAKELRAAHDHRSEMKAIVSAVTAKQTNNNRFRKNKNKAQPFLAGAHQPKEGQKK
jgi:hypothetical protein